MRMLTWRGALASIVLLAVGMCVIQAASPIVRAQLGGITRMVGAGDVDLQRGLIGWWKLDGNAKDSSPNGYDGIASGLSTTYDYKGRANSAYSFTGSSSIDTGVTKNVSKLSFSVWAYSTNNSGGVREVLSSARDCCGVYNGIDFSTAGYSSPRLVLWANGTAVVAQAPGGSYGTNEWAHFAGTYDGAMLRLYKNGVQVASTPYTTSIGAPSSSLKIGRLGVLASGYFVGTIDDVRYYDRALSTPEVTALYQSYSPETKLAQGEKGLLGWYKMDGNTKDSSPMGRNANLVNAALTVDRKGAVGTAYSFNGIDQQLNAGGFVELGTSNKPFSYTGWFNASGSSGDLIHLSATQIGYGGWCLSPVALNGGKLVAQSWDNNLVTATGATTVASHTWNHFAITWDSANGLRVYLNGVLDGSASQSIYVASGASSYVIMGYGYSGCAGDKGRVASKLDDVRVYGRALSAPEIAAQYRQYNAQVSIGNLQKGLVGYWPMNGNAKDATVFGANGVVSGAALTADRKGRANSAYAFSGGSYINVGHPAHLNFTGSFSYAYWIKFTHLSGALVWYPLSKGNYGTSGWSSGVIGSLADGNCSNLIGSLYYSGGNNTLTGCSTPQLTSGSWHHVVTTISGSSVANYINGQLAGTGTLATNFNATTDLNIGRRADGNWPISGSMDDVRIWNRALSPSEAMQLYREYR